MMLLSRGKIVRFWSEIILTLILHSEKKKKIYQKGKAEIQILTLTALNEKKLFPKLSISGHLQIISNQLVLWEACVTSKMHIINFQLKSKETGMRTAYKNIRKYLKVSSPVILHHSTHARGSKHFI